MKLRWFVLLLLACCSLIYGWINRNRTHARPEIVWGGRGVVDGKFNRPRAVAMNPNNQLFIVDFTARVQGFDRHGKHLGYTFTTPDYRNGRPSGLGIDRDGRLLVADSHYHTIRTYNERGEEIANISGKPGSEPGEWGYISDVVQTKEGFYFVSEFGQNDRITKLDAQGQFVLCWGKNGQAPGEFNRVRALALGPDELIYAADACNHRIQVFDQAGKLVRVFGEAGAGPGQFSYPYDLAFSPRGELYVVERGNQRVQKLTKEGTFLASWGQPGRQPGQLADPWALAIDSYGKVHVIDTENHRVQRIDF